MFNQAVDPLDILYTQLQLLLNQFNMRQPFNAQQDWLESVKEVYQKILAVYEDYIRFTNTTLTYNSWTNYFSKLSFKDDLNIQITESLFSYFRQYCINLDSLSEINQVKILLCIAQLLCTFSGQALITLLIKKHEESPFCLQFMTGTKLSIKPLDLKITRNIQINVPANFMSEPLTLFTELSSSDSTQCPLTFYIPYIALGHELIHVARALFNRTKPEKKIKLPINSVVYHFYGDGFFANREELKTIEGKLLAKKTPKIPSENELRKDSRLALRAGHNSATLEDTLKDKERIIKMIWLARIRRGERDFRDMALPNQFETPVFLSTNDMLFPPNTRTNVASPINYKSRPEVQAQVVETMSMQSWLRCSLV